MLVFRAHGHGPNVCLPVRGGLVVRRGACGDCGDLAVVGEQHGAEHGRVVGVELGAERGEELVFGACGVLLAPLRYGGAGPVQVFGVVFAEPHGVSWGARSAWMAAFSAAGGVPGQGTVPGIPGVAGLPRVSSSAAMSTRSVSSLIAVGSSPSARWLSYSSRAASCAARSVSSVRLLNIAGALFAGGHGRAGCVVPCGRTRDDGLVSGHAGAKGVKRAAGSLDAAGAASRVAQTYLPPLGAGCHPHWRLRALTMSSPRPCSVSGSGGGWWRGGGVGHGSQTRMQSSWSRALIQRVTGRGSVPGGAAARLAVMALVTSSLVTASASSLSRVSPHRIRAVWRVPRAVPGAVARGPSMRLVCWVAGPGRVRPVRAGRGAVS